MTRVSLQIINLKSIGETNFVFIGHMFKLTKLDWSEHNTIDARPRKMLSFRSRNPLEMSDTNEMDLSTEKDTEPQKKKKGFFKRMSRSFKKPFRRSKGPDKEKPDEIAAGTTIIEIPEEEPQEFTGKTQSETRIESTSQIGQATDESTEKLDRRVSFESAEETPIQDEASTTTLVGEETFDYRSSPLPATGTKNEPPKSRVSVWINESAQLLAVNKKEFKSPPDPKMAITALVTPKEVYLPWSYLISSAIFCFDWILLIGLLILLLFSVEYEQIIQQYLCHSLPKLDNPVYYRSAYFIWMGYVYVGVHLAYCSWLIFWHPIRKIWIKWRPKPAKFKQVYMKKQIQGDKYVQLSSGMSLVHPIYTSILLLINAGLFFGSCIYSPAWLKNVWQTSLTTFIVFIFVPAAYVFFGLVLLLFLILWTRAWFSLEKSIEPPPKAIVDFSMQSNDSNDQIVDAYATASDVSVSSKSSRMKRMFSFGKKRKSKPDLTQGDRNSSSSDINMEQNNISNMQGIVGRPSGMSIYILRWLTLIGIMAGAALIILIVPILLGIYAPASFLCPDSMSDPPKLVATGGLFSTSSDYPIAPHTLPAFYTALESDQITGGVSTHVYFTQDNTAIVMGDPHEVSIRSMTNVDAVFPDRKISSWSDLTLDELGTLQILMPGAKAVTDTGGSDIPRIASLIDLLHLASGYPQKQVYLIVTDTSLVTGNSALSQLQEIVDLIQEAQVQDHVTIVLQPGTQIFSTFLENQNSWEGLVVAQYGSLTPSYNFQTFLLPGPASVFPLSPHTIPPPPLPNSAPLALDHIVPRWDILRRSWCQAAATISTCEPILLDSQQDLIYNFFYPESNASQAGIPSMVIPYSKWWGTDRPIVLGVYCALLLLHLAIFTLMIIIYYRNTEKHKKRESDESC